MAVESIVIDHSYSELDDSEEGCMVWSDMRGHPHRMDGPAIVILKERFFTSNVRHVCWGRMGFSKEPVQMWYFHNKPHRIGGPAKVWGTDQQRVQWWVNGRRYYIESGRHPDQKEKYKAACIAFCEKHDIAMSGRMTKRAIPN